MEDYFSTKILITKEERKAFKQLARSKGMTFSGYLGQLVKRELYNAPSSPSGKLPPCPISGGEEGFPYRQ